MPKYTYGAKYIEVVKTELSDVVLFNRSSKEVLVIPLWELERVTKELTDLVIAEQDKKDEERRRKEQAENDLLQSNLWRIKKEGE
jgi:PHD/YefM family antitoxin component YafN of YafNO toxin-antitoxin module